MFRLDGKAAARRDFLYRFTRRWIQTLTATRLRRKGADAQDDCSVVKKPWTYDPAEYLKVALAEFNGVKLADLFEEYEKVLGYPTNSVRARFISALLFIQ